MVTDIDKYRKPICDFLLVININLHMLSRTVSRLLQFICHICAFDRGHVCNTLVPGVNT